MDRALQLAIREYVETRSNEAAHRVTQLLIRIRGAAWENIPSHSPDGLTYAGLLRALADLPDEQLGHDVCFYDAESELWRGATAVLNNTAADFNMDTFCGDPIIVDVRCLHCFRPFNTARSRRHFAEIDLEDYCDGCQDEIPD
jgi:hypothetical protein